jgi:7tm Odorant receptor
MKSTKFLEALKVPLRILKIGGLWENENVKTKHKVMQLCVRLLLCEVFTLLQIIYLFTTINLVDITKLISSLLMAIGLSIKSICLLKERKAIEALIKEAQELAALIETEDEKSLQALNNRANQIKKMFMANFGSGLIAMMTLTIVTVLFNTIGSHPPYKVLFSLWLPFNYQNNAYCFSFVAVYELMAAAVAFYTVISLDSLPIFFFNVGAGLLEELGERLSKVCDEGKEDKKAMKEFEKCIAIHIKIKRFVKNTEKRFSPMICAQGSISIIILCTVIFQLSKVNACISYDSVNQNN